MLLCILVLFTLLSANASAVDLRVSSGSAVTSNLLQDSSTTSAAVLLNSVGLAATPTPSIQAQVDITLAGYLDRTSYTNTTGSAEVWWLPIDDTSSLGLSMGAAFSHRWHTEEQVRFDRRHGGATIGLSHQFSRRLFARTSAALTRVDYPNDFGGDRTTLESAVGINVLIGSHDVLDISAFGGAHRYYFLDGNFLLLDPDDPRNSLVAGWTEFLGATARWSRPLGNRTGLSLSVAGDALLDTESRLLFGASTGYLTPWDRLTDRIDGTVQVKTFAIPKSINTLRLTAGRRWFHRAVEDPELFPLEIYRRTDDRFGSTLTTEVPLFVTPELLGRVTLTLSYRRVVSSLQRYTFNSWDATTTFELIR